MKGLPLSLTRFSFFGHLQQQSSEVGRKGCLSLARHSAAASSTCAPTLNRFLPFAPSETLRNTAHHWIPKEHPGQIRAVYSRPVHRKAKIVSE